MSAGNRKHPMRTPTFQPSTRKNIRYFVAGYVIMLVFLIVLFGITFSISDLF